MSTEKTQRERFEEAARELGVRLDEEKLKGALRRMKDQPPQEDDGGDDAKRKKHQ